MSKEIKFGKKLKELRLKRDLSQAVAAELLDLKQNTLSNYEKGISYPRMNDLIRVANFFEVSLDDLVYDLENETDEILKEHDDFLVDLASGMSIEELASNADKYKFVVDGQVLPKDQVIKILEQIEFEYFRYQRNQKR